MEQIDSRGLHLLWFRNPVEIPLADKLQLQSLFSTSQAIDKFRAETCEHVNSLGGGRSRNPLANHTLAFGNVS